MRRIHKHNKCKKRRSWFTTNYGSGSAYPTGRYQHTSLPTTLRVRKGTMMNAFFRSGRNDDTAYRKERTRLSQFERKWKKGWVDYDMTTLSRLLPALTTMAPKNWFQHAFENFKIRLNPSSKSKDKWPNDRMLGLGLLFSSCICAGIGTVAKRRRGN